MATPADTLPSPQQMLLASRIQGLFLSDGLSLADDGTAEVYRTTLKAARLILAGALAAGVVDADAHAVLADIVDAADDVPEIL